MKISATDIFSAVTSAVTNASTAKASTAQDSTPATTTDTKKNDVSKDAFLRLLVEQMKHQDPLAPQDSSQFLAQLAQFNSLDQLMSINSQLALLLKK
jgi:flagellar basal-body rod modification protein FlgD